MSETPRTENTKPMPKLKFHNGVVETLNAMEIIHSQGKLSVTPGFLVSSLILALAGSIVAAHESSDENMQELISRAELFLEESIGDILKIAQKEKE